MELEQKIRFALSTIQPMAEYTFPYVASVIGVHNEQKGEHVGSGLRCVLSGQRVLVTAAHVIAQAMNFPGFAVSMGYGRPPFVVHGEIREREHEDLAVYYLPDDYPDDGVAFWPQSRVESTTDQLATDYLFVQGFPRVRTEFSLQAAGIISNSMPYGAMQRLNDLPVDLAPWQFALHYDPDGIQLADGSSAKLLDPHGLSGSPVWRIGASGRPAKDWKPEWSMLAGIVTHWEKEAGILIATKATTILEIGRGNRDAA